MVSKAHPSAAVVKRPPPRPAGSGKAPLSIRQEEKGLCTPLPEKGNGEDSVWLTVGPSSAIEREVLQL
ncbi:hypothetical protein CC2G_015255 [Coprinopsis cinerea AmutBmut pab1-1]|nr:hypothetical protein CC2G_015255 [Coprinopsis cinerea AmutBmut pab1-1]